jgi:hypothetical protein
MSFGSSKRPDPPPVPPPAPTRMAPEVTAAKESLWEKLRRMQGRASTHLVSPRPCRNQEGRIKDYVRINNVNLRQGVWLWVTW